MRHRVPRVAYRPVLAHPAVVPHGFIGWEALHAAMKTAPRFVAEFGIGSGDWLLNEAAREPQTVFLGVEVAPLFFARVAKEAVARQLPNVFVAFGDARLTVTGNRVPPQTVDLAVYLFPDPWTKKRHAPRRMLAAPNVPFITQVLKPGGQLRLRTDVPDYVTDALENFGAAGFKVLQRSENRNPNQAVTRWERRKLAEGRVIEELWLQRPSDADLKIALPPVNASPVDERGIADIAPNILATIATMF